MDTLRREKFYSHIKKKLQSFSCAHKKLLYSTRSSPPHGGSAWRLQTMKGQINRVSNYAGYGIVVGNSKSFWGERVVDLGA